MTSELQLSLLLKRQVEDIYDRNSHASLLAWREYREEVRKRIHPKTQEPLKIQENDEFTISPYKSYLTKYKDSLSQQKYLIEMKSEAHSPKFVYKDRSNSTANLKSGKNKYSLETIFPLSTLNRLEDVISRANLNRTSREYCFQLQSLANTIITKLRE